MNKLLTFLTCILLTGCTQTMTMVHTEGVADDVVQEQSNVNPNVSPKISPTVNVPGVLKKPL